MTLHKLTAGDGYTYLTRQVAALDATERGHVALGDYYSQRGESPGVWVGSGLIGLVGMAAGQPVGEEQMKALFGEGRHPDAARLEREALAAGRTLEQAWTAGSLGRPFLVFTAPADGFRARCAREFAAFNADRGLPAGTPIPEGDRARIRSDLAAVMFADAYGRPPRDARELSGFIARSSRPATSAVAGYDLTFSPVKSVSALWALAPREVAEQVEAAHHAAVADTLCWLERHACFTRTGHGGVRQVETTGLIAAVFTHRDSRAGDPDLHSHVAVSNKVQTRDGRWLALDGRVLHKAAVAASEHYNTRLEAEMAARLGLRFTARPGGESGKRPVREIVGMDGRLLAAWSSRRRAIDARRGTLAADFQREHGRPPTHTEAIALAQQATLATRDPKHEPRSLGQQREAWRQEAIAVLGGPSAVNRMLETVLAGSPRASGRLTQEWVHGAAARVLDAVGAQRAVWQYWHVRAEAERLVRADAVAPGDVEAAVTRVTEHALSPGLSLPLDEPDRIQEPPELCRSDGASVYTVAGARLFTSQAVLDAEALLVEAAGRSDGYRTDPTVVGLALLESTANGVELNPGQAQLVRELACSGARVQLAIAPAGSGKTTALAALALAWTGAGGDVLGLAPSAIATAGLRDVLGGHCDTLAKLCWALTTGDVPDWVAGIGPRTLVIVDEAGMAGTIELAQAVAYVLGRGGSVRLVGDDRQLASVAAGGVLRDIAETRGAVTLAELVRFDDPAEAAATVALRDGDTLGLGFYLDRDRVHVGDLSTCAEAAYAAWAADRDRGVDAVLLAATRELVVELNRRARADRLARTTSGPGREVELADGNRASDGDLVISRRNDRTLRITATDWVKNGDRWIVRRLRRDGALDAVHLDTGRRIRLPADYVRAHVDLGYATTVHGAQGITAQTSHTVLPGAESRQLLYVAASRGRATNHLYLATVGDGDPHSIITPAAVRPPTATEILAGILARDGSESSASGTRRALADPAEQLRQAVERYTDALRFAAEIHVGTAELAELESAADRLQPGLTTAPAWSTLRGHLALRALDDDDPIAALQSAIETRELDTAADPAAVVDWRLDPSEAGERTGGPLPWLPAVPAALADDAAWGPYLVARAARVSACAEEVAGSGGGRPAVGEIVWAGRLEEPRYAALRTEVAVWRAATGVADDDRRPTGPPRLPAAERRYQRRLDAQMEAVGGPTARTTSCWAALADSIDPRIRRDEHWPTLADRLATADRAGLDAAGLLAAVAAQRPLPDDLPAAALWWRLAPHLVPAVADPGPTTAALRPAWFPALLDRLSGALVPRVLADPAWPALVAAVGAGARAGWDPTALITSAVRGLRATDPAGVDADGLVEALVFRVAALTDPAPIDLAEPLPPDLQPPEDLHLLPAGSHADVLHAATAGGWDGPGTGGPEPPRYFTPDPFTIGQDPTADLDYLLEQHFWATAVVGRDRLIELNALAAAFFADRYPGSWAPEYLRDRLGADPAADARFTVGYAPAGWTALTTHLRRHGVTDEEILAAGLGVRARTGSVIDRFRDRLTLPIQDGDGVIRGFVARRNPALDGTDGGGPKYLNTATTDLFTKGEQLFGLGENRQTLADGAIPAIVEGPLDAIALTLAGDGLVVGVATLGTALTDRQADQLRPCIRPGGPGTLVATDADAAGQRAAERIYWQLVARGDDPRRLVLPAGMDPADLLHSGGIAALREAIDRAPSLADQLIDACIARAGGTKAAAITDAVDETAAIIGALPPSGWLSRIDLVTDELGVPPGIVHLAVAEAGHAWLLDPAGQAAARLGPGGYRPRNIGGLGKRAATSPAAGPRAGIHPVGPPVPAAPEHLTFRADHAGPSLGR